MLLSDPMRLELDHRAYFLEAAPPPYVLLAADPEGRVSLCGPGFAVEALPAALTGSLRGIAAHPSEPWVAVSHADGLLLAVFNFEGELLFDEPSPAIPSKPGDYFESGFEDCLFSADGRRLWTTTVLSGRRILVQVRETAGWSVLAAATLEDPFGGSSASLYSCPDPDAVVLWLAAGQDEQQVLWAWHEGGKITCRPDPFLENTTAPAFSPDESWFLVLNEFGVLVRLSFPGVEPWRRVRSPLEPEDAFGHSPVYLDGSTALVGSASGRLFRVEVAPMLVLDEVLVPGHEPRSVREYLPNRPQDEDLCTDLSHFRVLGDWLVCVYPRERGQHGASWKDDLLCFPVEQLLPGSGSRP